MCKYTRMKDLGQVRSQQVADARLICQSYIQIVRSEVLQEKGIG
jgi:hypothetical protein